MKKVIVILVAIPILIGLSGCGKSGKKYVGKYVCEKQFGTTLRQEILEIKNDGTYNLTVEISGAFAVQPQIFTGRWEIDEDRILLSDDDGFSRIIGELKENTFVDRLPGGATYIKQN